MKISTGEKRRFLRHDAQHLLNFLIYDRGGRQTTYSMGKTLDVSEDGLRLETRFPVHSHDTLLITVGLEDELIELTGEVRYIGKSSNRYITGIHFSDISSKGKHILKQYTSNCSKQVS